MTETNPHETEKPFQTSFSNESCQFFGATPHHEKKLTVKVSSSKHQKFSQFPPPKNKNFKSKAGNPKSTNKSVDIFLYDEFFCWSYSITRSRWWPPVVPNPLRFRGHVNLLHPQKSSRGHGSVSPFRCFFLLSPQGSVRHIETKHLRFQHLNLWQFQSLEPRKRQFFGTRIGWAEKEESSSIMQYTFTLEVQRPLNNWYFRKRPWS